MNLLGLINGKDSLTNLVHRCTLNLLKMETYSHLLSILMLVDRPHDIQLVLSEADIDPYDLPQSCMQSVFPEPGTYVEEKFHPFLEQGISVFKEHEYRCVALELEDDCMDIDSEVVQEPVYKYVHIKSQVGRKIDDSGFLNIKYVICIGDEDFITVPIYRLYRFVRRETAEGTDVVLYDDEAVGTVAFDENCRRIREMLKEAWKLQEVERRKVIRRLLLKWHPDKNYGNEAYCTRVFNYIKEVIIKLERGQTIEDTVNNETGRTAPDTSGSAYYGMSCNVNQRAGDYSRAYHDNRNDYNRANNTGGFDHFTAAQAVRKDHGEAKRWMRQAKNDYTEAEVTLPVVKEVNGYNWICYTCHQACEKALKAAWFIKDANSVPLKSHSLMGIASDLSDDLMQQANLLERRLGEHTRMRYPDSVSRQNIPSDIFDCSDAEFSLNVAKTTIALADEYIQ